MRSINVLTVTGKPENRPVLVKFAEGARSYFPTETWDEIKYLGKLSLEHDVKIATSGKSFGAFLFEKLKKRIRRIRDSYRLINLLLGITTDPVVATYYFFDGTHFRRTLYLVHDYVNEATGIISLFAVNDRYSSKVVAHGLGHSKGLSHHLEPVDLMYSELLKTSTLQVEGFCKVCLRKLTGG